MAKFTKGRWVLDELSGEIWADKNGEDFLIGHVITPDNNFDDECSIELEKELEANARLIVSAPEIYNALDCANAMLHDPRIKAILDYIEWK